MIVADNGSTDGSQGIAREYGARVIDVERRGYGHALRAGIQAARGRYIIMGDSDDSYDFTALAPFVEQLRAGTTWSWATGSVGESGPVQCPGCIVTWAIRF